MLTRNRIIAGGSVAVLVAAGGIFAATQLANAASGDSTTLYACVKSDDGQMRMVDAGTTCRTPERLVSWSVTGPQGVPGPHGSPGPQGVPGPAGPAGDSGAAAASVVGFLSAPGITGDSTATGHVGDVEITAFELSVTNSGTTTGGGGAGAGKADLSPITIVKHTDKASVDLMAMALSGSHLRDATVTLCDPANCAATTTGVYALSDVLVSSDKHSAVGDTESLAITAVKLKYTVGSDFTAWDFAANRRL